MKIKKTVRSLFLLTSFIILLLTPISNFYIKYGLIYLILDLFLLSVAPFSKISKNKSILKYFIGMIIGAILIISVISILLGLKKIDLVLNDNNDYKIILLFSLFWLTQSFFEEYMMRGILYRLIGKILGCDVAIILTAFLFSLFHIANNNISLIPLINIFLFGLLCGIIVKIFKNIYLVSGLHFAWNYFQGNIFGIDVSGISVEHSIFKTINSPNGDLFHGGKFGIEGGIVTLIIFLIMITILILSSYKKHQKNEIYYIYNTLDAKFFLSKVNNSYVYINGENYLIMDLYSTSLVSYNEFIPLKNIELLNEEITIDISNIAQGIYCKFELLEQFEKITINRKINFKGGNYFYRSSLDFEINH